MEKKLLLCSSSSILLCSLLLTWHTRTLANSVIDTHLDKAFVSHSQNIQNKVFVFIYLFAFACVCLKIKTNPKIEINEKRFEVRRTIQYKSFEVQKTRPDKSCWSSMTVHGSDQTDRISQSINHSGTHSNCDAIISCVWVCFKLRENWIEFSSPYAIAAYNCCIRSEENRKQRRTI